MPIVLQWWFNKTDIGLLGRSFSMYAYYHVIDASKIDLKTRRYAASILYQLSMQTIYYIEALILRCDV